MIKKNKIYSIIFKIIVKRERYYALNSMSFIIQTLKQFLKTATRCFCSLLVLVGVDAWSHGLVDTTDSRACTRPELCISYDDTRPSSCNRPVSSCRALCRISRQPDPFSRLLMYCHTHNIQVI